MPINLRDLKDTDFGTLNKNKNKNVMRYNHSTGKFDVVDADSVLTKASETPLPSEFVEAVQNEIDVNNITFTGLDGGVF